MAVSQGIWAVLFVLLLFYVLKEHSKREDRLIACVEKFGDDMATKEDIQDLKKDIDSMQDEVKEVRDDVKELKGKVGNKCPK